MVSKNFFSALDDSDNEGEAPKVVVHKKAIIDEISTMVPLDQDGSGIGKLSNSEVLSMYDGRRPINNYRNTQAGHGRSTQAREGKRTHDRHSGTGRGREIKKGGSGPHNWGSDKYEARKAEGTAAKLQEHEDKVNVSEFAEVELTVVNVHNGAEEKDKSVDPKEEWTKKIEEEEKKTMTLSEFLKLKKNPDSELFQPKEIRVVDNEFIGKTSKITIKEDVLIMGKEKSLRKKCNKKPDKVTLDVEFHTMKPMSNNRRNGEKERRGGSRGGRKDREVRKHWHGVSGNIVPERTLNVMDPSAFPSL